MPACLNCGNRLCKGETKCFTCEAPVEKVVTKGEANLGRFRVVVTILFFLCLALNIASIFTDIGASFWKCSAATVILHFVKTAAGQMAESKNS